MNHLEQSTQQCALSRVENSKTSQNQISKCFSLVYMIYEQGMIFVFFNKKNLIAGNGFQKINSYIMEKWPK